MIAFSPSDLFRDDTELSTPWKDTARQRLFHTTAVHVLAEMAWQGATTDELRGAKAFLTKFLNLAERVEAISVTAPARLDYDVERRVAERHAKKE